MFYYIEPEVSGGFGDNTIIDTTVHPPIVTKLHYHFKGWLGDDLIESFPCYIVSEQLQLSIKDSDLTGYKFAEVEISQSSSLAKEIPMFYWLNVIGEPGVDDFGIATDHRLVISDKALTLLKQNQIKYADLEEF